jgi:hypothetical protein
MKRGLLRLWKHIRRTLSRRGYRPNQGEQPVLSFMKVQLPDGDILECWVFDRGPSCRPWVLMLDRRLHGPIYWHGRN